jgi:LmbE family N-acetylglucosaminyl deacetylase
MKYAKQTAQEYTPHTANQSKVKFLGIAAHHDDIEIMATDGIGRGFRNDGGSFYAVVTTDGGGSARSGEYANFTDEEMKSVRIDEQKRAAEVGCYNGLALLNYTSSETKMSGNPDIIADYIAIILKYQPEIIYTHNICDKHPTHIGVALKVIAAIRSLPYENRPQKLYGCEVWRDLDWLNDEEKVCFDLSADIELTEKLLSVFDSQIAGGKRYDLATAGRRFANATYAASHSIDKAVAMGYAMDLTPLITNVEGSVVEFARNHIRNFEKDVVLNLQNL